MRLALLFAILLLCGVAANAKSVKIQHDSPALEFTYEWPAQAAAIPALNRRFLAEAARDYRRHLKLGREDKELYHQQQRGSVSDFYSKKWSTAGESPRLLSLQYEHATYTGARIRIPILARSCGIRSSMARSAPEASFCK